MSEVASLNNFFDAIEVTYCTFEGETIQLKMPFTLTHTAEATRAPEDCGTAAPTNVISTSCSYNEAYLTPLYTARQCAEYAKLGLMGITVLYSSGDYGVAENGSYCLTSNGIYSLDNTIFNPSFVGTCPYITSVGATQANPNSAVYEPEGACGQVIYYGGGFSNYFAMPDYSRYLDRSGTSRGFPDTAANGTNFVVAIDDTYELICGTSCSSPVSGSILTIGFINLTIYSPSFAGVFNDIIMGGNQGCGIAAYTALPGIDPVTGLGTPNFPKLLASWLLLP
ncbi:peptidase S8/S53 domain-containing protein [Suillus bovinus]|uniref:peptidase S8/S53 domain-containing protein n=1 Tax=Suillus bovinus TaxID=48563 RepID=UPI001B86757B|nr:peptidase S8/S53 domain-containing protein [Suillus bovinus]KAG2129692.1 peptidase S8/S53 domain-containing protein [Suillus bovinus]